MHLHKGKYLDNRTYSILAQRKPPPSHYVRCAGGLTPTIAERKYPGAEASRGIMISPVYMIFRLFHSLFEVVNVSMPDWERSPVALVNQEDPRSDDGPTNSHRASPDC